MGAIEGKGAGKTSIDRGKGSTLMMAIINENNQELVVELIKLCEHLFLSYNPIANA